MSVVGDADRPAGLIGQLQWLKARRVHSLARHNVDGGLALSLGNGKQLVPL